MDPKYAPFITFGDEDVSPQTPRLTLELQPPIPADPTLSITLPYTITFKLSRLTASIPRPIIFCWSPFQNALINAELVLLHITDNGPEKVEVPRIPSNLSSSSVIVTGYNQTVWELPTGGAIEMRNSLTSNYQQLLKPGEKYELLWPGAEIEIWDWGSKKEYIGKELKSNETRDENKRLPRLILPATSGSVLTFTAKEEKEPWPDRPETTTELQFQQANLAEQSWRRAESRRRNPPISPPPISLTERVDGAPVLSMHLSCPPAWKDDSIVDLTITVTYAPNPEENPKPITIHTEAFNNAEGPREGLRLYRLVNNDNWVRHSPDDGFGTGFGIFDDPPVSVSVGSPSSPHSDRFITLSPNESWSKNIRVQNGTNWTSLPADVEIGQRFKYVVKGAVVDWWDCGTQEDHREKGTVVKLPCWIAGDVVEPADNEGRPKLVVPESNEVEFVYAGGEQGKTSPAVLPD